MAAESLSTLPDYVSSRRAGPVFRSERARQQRHSMSSSALWGKEFTVRYTVDGQVVLLRAPEGPLAAYIELFAGALRMQGYALESIHRQVLIAVGFSRWLKRQEVAPRSITAEHPLRYLR